MINIFFYLVIIHFLTDFMLQIFGIGTNKRGFNIYMIAHIFITTIFPAIFLLFFNFPINNILVLSVLIAVSHISVDIVRQEILAIFKINSNQKQFWILLGLDQMLHIYFIYLGIQWYLS